MRLHTILAAFMFAATATAQTLNVKVGSVTYQFPSAQTGEMTYNDGTTLTVMGKTFQLSDISSMTVDNTSVTDNLVSVAYDGTSASVTVAGNIAQYVTPTVSGAHVSIVQSDALEGELTYSLSGSSPDGEFYTEGSYKATIELLGLTLTNKTPVYSGAAIHVQNGKRIAISVKKDTENTLVDASTGSQKGCIYVKGHAEFKGKGILNVTGKLSHAIKSGEYCSVKNCTINVLSAVGDGINCNEYFLMESGSLVINSVGDDGIQADIDNSTGAATAATDDAHTDEDTGSIYIDGGTISIKQSAYDGKGMKSTGDICITDGDVSVVNSGSSAAKGIKSEGSMTISGGNIYAKSSNHEGIESKGTLTITGGYVYAEAKDDAINSASHMTISGGSVMANSGGNDGLDANGNLYIKDGNVFAIAASQPEVGIDANTEGGYKLYISGGNVISIGGFESGASITNGTAKSASYSKNTTYGLYNGSTLAFAFKVPSNSSMGSSMALYTTDTPALSKSVTTSGTTFWNGYGYTDCSGGSSVTLSTYSSGGGGGGFGPGGGGGGRPFDKPFDGGFPPDMW